MPAPETLDFEREFEELVRELRAIPAAAPEPVRERVAALGEPAAVPDWRTTVAAIRPRRALLVLAPVCLVAIVGAALVHGLVSSGERPSGARQSAVSGGSVGGGAQSVLPSGTSTTPPVAEDNSGFGRLVAPPLKSAVVPPGGTRLQDYDAYLRVRVRDLDALSSRTSDAMRVARSLNGYVESVQYSTTAGQPGQADVVLRVPVARVEDALLRLAALGTVVQQNVSIRDLEQTVRQQRSRILSLRVFIARLTSTLRDPSLAADVRLRLQFQLAGARRQLTRLTGENKATLREAALSQISLTLSTEKALGAVTRHRDGRALRAARDAAGFLAAAGAIALYLLIVLSPLLLLAVAAFFGLRTYRRREERRLLARA